MPTIAEGIHKGDSGKLRDGPAQEILEIVVASWEREGNAEVLD